mmetsp:Transcript_4776/g.8013  ORF Transcript_4776/g.8013 Transcript_4776/m.8013 type:complete len:228 (+) Transcript_4776:156-839(+)
MRCPRAPSQVAPRASYCSLASPASSPRSSTSNASTRSSQTTSAAPRRTRLARWSWPGSSSAACPCEETSAAVASATCACRRERPRRRFGTRPPRTGGSCESVSSGGATSSSRRSSSASRPRRRRRRLRRRHRRRRRKRSSSGLTLSAQRAQQCPLVRTSNVQTPARDVRVSRCHRARFTACFTSMQHVQDAGITGCDHSGVQCAQGLAALSCRRESVAKGSQKLSAY